jgi:hypothetical protein
MSYYLWELRPYFRQVAGQLVLGSMTGMIMNTAIVLPAILLGRAIDAALAFERGEAGLDAVGWAPWPIAWPRHKKPIVSWCWILVRSWKSVHRRS